MISQTGSAVQRFIASARKLYIEEQAAEKRWQKPTPLLRELLADAEVRARSKEWPACQQTDRAENLLRSQHQAPDSGLAPARRSQ